MNIENKVNEIIKTTAWYNQQIVQKKDSDRQKLKIQTQHLFHEISLIRYFSYNSDSHSFGHSNISYEKIITAFIQHEPLRLHSKLSPNISQFITQWVFDFTNRPRKFAEGVIKTLPNFPIDSGIFIYVTFPSMFYHFQTDEYLNLAVEFLEEIIQKAPANMSISFVSSFLLSAAKFVKSLWSIFDELVDKRSPIRTYSDYFIIFIDALKTSSLALTKQHIHIIQYFKQTNLENFARCLLSNFLKITYDESHLSKIHDQSRELIEFFKYAENNPSSPHFTKIYNSLIPQKGTFWVPFHSDLIETRIPLVMNCHEFFLIQQIAKDNPDISNLKYIQFLMIPKSVYLDFCPVYFDVVFPLPPSKIKEKLGSLIFSEKFYEKEKNELNFKPETATNDNENDDHLLSRKWRQINAYARSKNVHPLSFFSKKKDQSFDELSSFNFEQDSPLFEYAVKDSYSEALKIHSQFEVLINRLLLADFLSDLYRLLYYMLKVVLQKFTLRLINSDRIYDNFYLNDLIGACSYNCKFANYAILRFFDHFEEEGGRKKTFRLTFLPSQMKKERIKKFLTDKELFDISLIEIGNTKQNHSNESNEQNINTNSSNDSQKTNSLSNDSLKNNSAPNDSQKTNSNSLSNDSLKNSASNDSQKTNSNSLSNDSLKNSASNDSQKTASNSLSNTNNQQKMTLMTQNPTQPTRENPTNNTNRNSFPSQQQNQPQPITNEMQPPSQPPPRSSSFSSNLQQQAQKQPTHQPSQNRQQPPQFHQQPPQNRQQPFHHNPPSKEAPPRPPSNLHLPPTRSPSFSLSSAAQRSHTTTVRTSSRSTSASPSHASSQKEEESQLHQQQQYRHRRRHSTHSIEFIHTSSEFSTSINRVLRSRGRTKSPLEICMISKLIDEWKIFYFDSNEGQEFEKMNNKQLFGNGEVCEYIISSLQKSFISNIELWKTKAKMERSNNGKKFSKLKSAFKYILYVAKEINGINNLKKGAAIFQMIEIGTLIDQISVKLLSEKKSEKIDENELSRIQFEVFEMCLLMSNSQGLFETFLLYEKLSADIIGFNTSFPLEVMKSILIIVHCFWKMIKKFDNELYLSCIHFVEHMQYSFSI